MTILVAVKKNGRVFLGADRITTFGNEYTTDLVNGSKIMKLKHAYLATSGYTLLDNVIEHLFNQNHKMMENEFKNRSHVFTFFLELYNELKKSYTLIDAGKDTYASMYNVFLVVTPTNIYGISNNLAVHEYEKFAAKGAGSDYSQGCLYGIYELLEDGFEITRVSLEAACHFSIYCKEPIDVLEVKLSDFGKVPKGYKAHEKLQTMTSRKGMLDFIAVSRSSIKNPAGKNGEKVEDAKPAKASKTKATVAVGKPVIKSPVAKNSPAKKSASTRTTKKKAK
jgi:ATP-dependent protease HslVU (ClpYQ) peptidase subunit